MWDSTYWGTISGLATCELDGWDGRLDRLKKDRQRDEQMLEACCKSKVT